MIVVMACYAKAVDQLFKLQKLKKLPSSDLISINGSRYYWCYHRRDAKEWSSTVPRMQICSRGTDVEASLIWADKRHTEEESLLASPVKTWLSLANSKCPITGDGPSSSVHHSTRAYGMISATCGDWFTLPDEPSLLSLSPGPLFTKP